MNCVVSDVGGTNIRFSYVADSMGHLGDIVSMKCADFSTIDDAFAAYASKINLDERMGGAGLDAVAIAVAAPVNDDQINFTNNHWRFDKTALWTSLPAKQLLVLNDFTAQALAQSDPTANGNIQLLDGHSDERAPLLVVGPGTGLGVSALLPTSVGPLPLEGQGGHVSFSPRSDVEIALYNYACQTFDHVTMEHFVSGAGLERIYGFLADTKATSPAVMDAPDIGTRALAEDGLCRVAALMLLDILGTVIADQTLAIGAWRGVVIAGGIVPQLAPLVPASNFAHRIRSVGSSSPLTENLPVWLSIDPYAGLRGALAGLNSAHLAQRILTD